MNSEEANRVHVNDCVRDDELSKADAAVAAAEPAEWRVRDGQVVRYSGGAVGAPGSLAFIAYARSAVPRFTKGIRTLEQALRSSWGAARASLNELSAEREAHTVTAQNAAKGKTGPEDQLGFILEAVKEGAMYPAYAEIAIKEWIGGKALDAYVPGSIMAAQKRRREDAETARQFDVNLQTELIRLRQVEKDSLAHRCEPKPPRKPKLKPVETACSVSNDKDPK